MQLRDVRFTSDIEPHLDEIAEVFRAAFAASEGDAEGDLIGRLARELLTTTPAPDLFSFSAMLDGQIVGSIIFTRVTYPDDQRSVFILSPVAIQPAYQGRGLGQHLIAHGLATLGKSGIEMVLTYGDINFYSKLGFAQIGEDIAAAPLPLSYPEGWLGQSVKEESLRPLKGPSSCAPALNNPAFW